MNFFEKLIHRNKFEEGQTVMLPVVEGADQFEEWMIKRIYEKGGKTRVTLAKIFFEHMSGQRPAEPGQVARQEIEDLPIEKLEAMVRKG